MSENNPRQSYELFSEHKLNDDTVLKNRFVLAPLTRGRAGPSRVPNEIMGKYYEQRSCAGLLIAEATAVSAQGYGWPGAPGNYTQEHADNWKPIVDKVHAKNAKFFLQLWHMGRASHSSYHESKEIVSASALKIEGDHVYAADGTKQPHEVPRALETKEIPSVVAQYKKSAELAKSSGFDGVEIHAANGYLIDQFLQTCSNKRTDNYGGSKENRFRFLNDVVEAVKEVYPANCIGVRLSPNGTYNGMGSETNDTDFVYFMEQLGAHGLAYLHIMDGKGFGFHNKCSQVRTFHAKTAFKGTVIGNIGFDRDTAEGTLRSGAADLIAFGRPFITNPDLVDRYYNDWPLTEFSDPSKWYGGNEEGYCDYPNYQEKEEENKSSA